MQMLYSDRFHLEDREGKTYHGRQDSINILNLYLGGIWFEFWQVQYLGRSVVVFSVSPVKFWDITSVRRKSLSFKFISIYLSPLIK
jgi:hypothetical protein